MCREDLATGPLGRSDLSHHFDDREDHKEDSTRPDDVDTDGFLCDLQVI